MLPKKTSKLKKRFSKIKWYYQGAEVKPWYIGFPWYACFHFALFGRPMPVYYKGIMLYYVDGRMEVYFPTLNLRRVAEFYLKKQSTSPSFIFRLKSRWDAAFKRDFLPALRRLQALELGVLPQGNIWREFEKFSLLYEKLWQDAIFHDAFDAWGEDLFSESLAKTGKTFSREEVHVLSSPKESSWLQKERAGLLAIAHFMKKRVLPAKYDSDLLKLRYPKIWKELENHAGTYHWIYNDYATVRELKPEDFYRQAIKLAQNPALMAEERQKLASVRKTARKRRILIRSSEFSRQSVAAVQMLSEVAEWRDSRKSFNQMAGSVLAHFAAEFSRRLSIPYADIEHMFWWEFSLKAGKLRKAVNLARSRQKGCFYLNSNPGAISTSGLYGKDARDMNIFMKSLLASKTLSGRPAYPGKVKGRVRMVFGQKDFHKMKKGDILFAPNTRPEYVPVMKMAGAIVTEEGGVTSHAAIVSRELRKPCIVGAQGIMAVIADGDIVEVDADKGIVSKI